MDEGASLASGGAWTGPGGLVVVDVDETVVYDGRNGDGDLTGSTAGRSVEALVDDRDADALVAAVERAIASGETSSVDVRLADEGVWRTATVAAGTGDGGAAHLVFREIDDPIGRDLRRLYRLSSDRTLSFEEKVRRMLDAGCERFDLDIGFLSFIEGEFEVVFARGSHEKLQDGARAPLSETYCRKALGRAEPLAVTDAETEGWAGDPAYEEYGLGCYVGTTVTVDGETYGTLCFADTAARDRPFTDGDLLVVDLVAQWVGYEIERIQREENLEREVERRDEVVSFLSHDLRNPLMVAEARVNAALDEFGPNEHLDKALHAVERIEDLVEGMVQLAREGDDVDETTSVDLAETAVAAWETIETPEATLRTADPGSVQADPSRLQTLVENLLSNAVDHGGESVTVTVGSIDDEAGFYVADDGPGIPSEERDAVFEKRVSEDGLGLGLAIVGRIAEAHGWDVTATESDAGGARVEVRTRPSRQP